MSLILTPPPTVMVFFKEISLKNESTGKKFNKLKSFSDILHKSYL